MASPFAKFRKNQKKWLAFLGVICMFTFIIGGMGMSCIASWFNSSNQLGVVVETKVRPISRGELQRMSLMRDRLNQFLFKIKRGRNDQLTTPLFGGVDEQSVFDTWLKAQKSIDMGIRVSDDAISQFIAAESRRTVVKPPKPPVDVSISKAELLSLLASLGITESQLYASLRTELLARRLDDLFAMENIGFDILGRLTTARKSIKIPSQHKETWDKLHRYVHVEFIRLLVEGFKGDVDDPSDEKLRMFFEIYREIQQDPDSAVPGFELSHLARFQSFQVNFQRLVAAATEVVSDWEIEKLYETKTEENAFDIRFNLNEWEKSLESSEEKPSEKDESDAAKKTSKKNEAGSSVKLKKAKNPSASKKNKGSGAASTPRLRRDVEAADVPLIPVSFQPEATDTKTKDKKPPVDAKKTADPPEPEKKENDGEKKKEETTEPTVEPKLLSTIQSDLIIPEKITDGDPPKHWPLWWVKDKLRDEIAERHARADIERLIEILKKSEGSLDQHKKARHQWDIDNRRSKTRTSPKSKPSNPLDDPKRCREIVDAAWKIFVVETKEQWTKIFEDEKELIAAKIKQIEPRQTEPFEAPALENTPEAEAETIKNENWLTLLANQKNFDDVEGLVAKKLEKWLPYIVSHRLQFERKLAEGEAEPFEAPAPEALLTLSTTPQGEKSRGLTRREFEKAFIPIANSRVEGQEFVNAVYQRESQNDRQRQGDSLGMFHPTIAKLGDDRFLFWKIAERPVERLIWVKDSKNQDSNLNVVDHKVVLSKWKEVEARNLAESRASEIRDQLAKRMARFPIGEIQRLFIVDGGAPIELSKEDRDKLKLDRLPGQFFAVVVEDYKDGKRSVEKTDPKEPFEAPPTGLSDAEDRARQLAAAGGPNVLVIVGKSIGSLGKTPVFRGVKGFRQGADKQVESWPGLLAGRSFVIRSEEKLRQEGEKLDPLTWFKCFPNYDVKGLEAPGRVLMSTIFDLDRGGLGVALNKPQTMAYIVQVTDFDYRIAGSDISHPSGNVGEFTEYPDDLTLLDNYKIREAIASDPDRYVDYLDFFQKLLITNNNTKTLLRDRWQESTLLQREWMESLYLEYQVQLVEPWQ